MKTIGVYQVYNGAIADMRRSGQTLRVIGDKLGVSGERVRQVLVKYYGSTFTADYLTLPQLARLLQTTPYRLRKLKILPEGIHRYTINQIPLVRKEIAKQFRCRICGQLLPPYHQCYCESCGKESERYHYPFMNEEAKRKASKCSREWQKNHPERNRQLLHKAHRNYRLRHPDKIKTIQHNYYMKHNLKSKSDR